MLRSSLFAITAVVFSLNFASANTNIENLLPPVDATPEQLKKIWNDYCVGEQNSASIPQPNYENPLVQKVAIKLAQVAPLSYYFYSGPLKAYGLKMNKGLVSAPSQFPVVKDLQQSGKENANAFLTILCGEFRDRPTMIEQKLIWASKMILVPSTQVVTKSADGKEVINFTPVTITDNELKDKNFNIWSKITAENYGHYLQTSSSYWYLKQSSLSEQMQLGLGKINPELGAERFIEGQDICETKYMISEYVLKNEYIESLESFKAGYEKFKTKCVASDFDYYFNFRGDSNYKPNSPESNGMIWYSSSITNQCQTTTKAKPGSKLTDQDCENYFKKPFTSRWLAARAGLATWMLWPNDDETMSMDNSMITIIPNLAPQNGPFSYTTESLTTPTSKFLEGYNFSDSSFGLNQILSINSSISSSNASQAYRRLRDAVNRHTDWYASGYDDQMGMQRSQAYSPFVASSYEMHESDQFTAPGVTVNSPSDGQKHWMFIFKVKKTNLYHPEKVVAGEPIDFNRQWFDETSFGTNSLADSEKAFDRLGTALEGEMDTILYLHNISTSGEANVEGHKSTLVKTDNPSAIE